MINFFRKNRQSVLNEGKTSKYFKYATGEVVLVMIGILLALQVNEWNNERNRKKAEQVAIEQLITDLSQSQHELEDEEFYNLREAREYSKVLRAFWKTELPDDIQKYVRSGVGGSVYSPVLGTAHSLINSGRLDIISSKELKNDIVTYVDVVSYRLKDINRYEESYFRPGSALLRDAIPSSIRSKEDINAQVKSSRWQRDYNRNLNDRPEFIEKIPFKSDAYQLFQDKNFFMANQKLLIYHRNIAWKYREILNSTNQLLVKLYLTSDKYHRLGKKLSDENYYIVFEAEDLQILKRADALISDPSKWNKNDVTDCDDDRAKGKYSLECALKTALQNVMDEWKDAPLSRPAIRLVMHKLLEDENRRYVSGMLTDWNNHPDTTFEDVKNLFSDCIEVIENQLTSNDKIL
jgi:hypothetical protein